MEKATITFLGTGNAIPTPKRNHTAILFQYKTENILIDCGEGTQRQFKMAKTSPNKISKILLTHWHGDHILGLPGLIQTLEMSDYSKTLEIYGPKNSKKHFSILERLIGKDRIQTKIIEKNSGKVYETPDLLIECIPMKHGTPSLAYSITIKEKLRLDKKKIKSLGLPNSPILKKLTEGKSITHNKKKIKSSQVCYKEPERKLTIILDTLYNPNTVKIAKNSTVLVSESTFSETEAELAKDHKHLTAKQASMIAKKSKSESLILTHISQRYESNSKILLDEAKATFKNTQIAKDLDSIHF